MSECRGCALSQGGIFACKEPATVRTASECPDGHLHVIDMCAEHQAWLWNGEDTVRCSEPTLTQRWCFKPCRMLEAITL